MDPKEEVRHRMSVEEVVGEYLELKPAGGGSLKTTCPFHNEKTPSFYVSKEKQIWHCFGCDKGGDIFAFLMEMEGVEFPEALRLLAKKAGVEIPRYDSTQSNERARLIEINELARRFFEKVYVDSESAKPARDYVASRGIPEELRETFGLGYAPDKWEALMGFLGKRGFGNKEILAAGLALKSKKGTGLIDRFRNRLMVPLRDAHGNTIAFTGRIMPGADEKSGPKYMNSPETEVYHKGEMLYGLSKAKQAIKQEKAVIVVEGNLDVVASHKAGVKNLVASSGTALTQTQIQLLKRYTDRLIFCFDQDAAGFNAARRGIHLATQLSCDVAVLLIPDEAGKDPDDVVQRDPELWKTIVSKPIPIMDYYFRHAVKGKDLGDVQAKREVGNFLVAEIGRLQDKIEQEHWLGKLSEILRMNIDVLRGMITKAPAQTAQSTQKAQLAVVQPYSRYEKVFSVLLSLFLQFPQVQKKIKEGLQAEWVPDHPLGSLYQLAQLSYDSPEQDTGTSQSFFSTLEEQVKNDVSMTRLLQQMALQGERLASEIIETEVPSYTQEHLDVLAIEWKKARRQFLQRELRAAEGRGDKEAVGRLLQEFQTL